MKPNSSPADGAVFQHPANSDFAVFLRLLSSIRQAHAASMTETSTNTGASPGSETADRLESLVIAELQHRAKNLFAIIHALALRSFADSSTLDEARDAFIGRLQALASAEQQLLGGSSNGRDLNDLIRSALEPFADRITISGTEVFLHDRAVRNFALALHELATNACKYGALSNAVGVVSVTWVITNAPLGEILTFRWQERGGPPVLPPSRTGFGTSLLQATLGQGRLEYAVEGLNFEAKLPVSAIVQREGALDKRSAADLLRRKKSASAAPPANNST
jgi:two-component sensor histidine kinase